MGPIDNVGLGCQATGPQRHLPSAEKFALTARSQGSAPTLSVGADRRTRAPLVLGITGCRARSGDVMGVDTERSRVSAARIQTARTDVMPPIHQRGCSPCRPLMSRGHQGAHDVHHYRTVDLRRSGLSTGLAGDRRFSRWVLYLDPYRVCH